MTTNQFDPTDIRGMERAFADRQARDQLQADTEASDIIWLMNEPKGRRIVWRLLEQAGVFRTSFNTNSMTMAFNEGQRNIGLRVLGLVHGHCPALYNTMVEESKNGSNQHADD